VRGADPSELAHHRHLALAGEGLRRDLASDVVPAAYTHQTSVKVDVLNAEGTQLTAA
jgi:hypothetical protein